MIHAYAIEPQVVVGWSEPRSYRFVWDKFGIGTPRVLLEFPVARWQDEVMTVAAREGLSELRWKRLDELLLVLRKGKVRRPGQAYDDAVSWLENAEVEHDRRRFLVIPHPFAAIVAMANPRGHSAVIAEANLGRANDPRWAVATAATPSREAHALASAVAAMLHNCTELHIVDPHFGPENRRHRVVLETLSQVAASSAGRSLKVTVHCSNKSTLGFFEEKAAEIAQRLPTGVTVFFKRWAERDGGERFHNRYLLTDIGGVTFGGGLDEAPPRQRASQTEDINLMDKSQYERRWRQFAGGRVQLALIDQPKSIRGQGV
ncbi:MAG: hypothetical protein GXP55_12545 [Deltaproteobacteria bacterium]|nr:hypothetical protein [Deltaproteobacteria bacterium]